MDARARRRRRKTGQIVPLVARATGLALLLALLGASSRRGSRWRPPRWPRSTAGREALAEVEVGLSGALLGH